MPDVERSCRTNLEQHGYEMNELGTRFGEMDKTNISANNLYQMLEMKSQASKITLGYTVL